MNRVFAQASAWTFTIQPIADLLRKYVRDRSGWVDPFAGKTSPAGITNDFDPAMPTQFHMDAQDFCLSLTGRYEGVILDPPYSYRQVTEHYRAVGRRATALDTSSNFLARIKRIMAPKIKIGGIAICCGWNSNGFGRGRGFTLIEVLVVAHGSHHNDTIVTVERKTVEGENETLNFGA